MTTTDTCLLIQLVSLWFGRVKIYKKAEYRKYKNSVCYLYMFYDAVLH